MKEVFDTPVYILFDGQPGVPQTSTATGRYYFDGDVDDFDDVEMSFTSTLTAFPDTVTVPYGTVNDAIRVDVTFDESVVDGYSGSFDGVYYFQSTFGVVYANPVPGFYSADLVSTD